MSRAGGWGVPFGGFCEPVSTRFLGDAVNGYGSGSNPDRHFRHGERNDWRGGVATQRPLCVPPEAAELPHQGDQGSGRVQPRPVAELQHRPKNARGEKLPGRRLDRKLSGSEEGEDGGGGEIGGEECGGNHKEGGGVDAVALRRHERSGEVGGKERSVAFAISRKFPQRSRVGSHIGSDGSGRVATR